MVPLCSPQPEEGQQCRGLAGSVLGSGQAREWLQFLMGREAKDALLYLRKWLREAARKEDVQLKATRGKLTGMVMLNSNMLHLCLGVWSIYSFMDAWISAHSSSKYSASGRRGQENIRRQIKWHRTARADYNDSLLDAMHLQ